MAPPTPIFGKEELSPLLEKIHGPCQLYSLIQNECTYDGQGYICVPFKRLFEECSVGDRTIRVEVTDAHTNKNILNDEIVERFWNSTLSGRI
ncbi:LAFE_0E00738g1_1 [Lachancea fermentati]|uniref:LAFE_0E00738g1_1 n=1 Tax=Lachancea fermentati TaxID=4955 RepID=A0A1G4MC85_LACFM|nr:LAFE_0E00738g1_1 [Lachancea fermentati]